MKNPSRVNITHFLIVEATFFNQACSLLGSKWTELGLNLS